MKNLKLTYAYANTPRWQSVGATLKNAFAKAGITLQTKAIDITSYYTLVGKIDNPYDIYRTGWGADWPSAGTVIPPTLDGRLIGGRHPELLAPERPARQRGDRPHQQDHRPPAAGHRVADPGGVHPEDTTPRRSRYEYDKYFNVYGDGLGGVSYNTPLGTINPNTVFVK